MPLVYLELRSSELLRSEQCNYLSKFRDNLSVSEVSWNLRTRPVSCPEKSVINYHYLLRNNQYSAVLSYFTAEGWSNQSVYYFICIKYNV
jgi:hypothetical protein